MKLVRSQWVFGVVAAGVVVLLVFISRPGRVAREAVESLAEAKTGAFVATVQLENAQATQQLLGEAGSVEIVLDGVFLRREKDNERDRLQADVTVTTKTDSLSLTLEGEARFVGDKAYLFIEKSPAAFGALTQLKGQWLELPRGDASQPAETAISSDFFTKVERDGSANLSDVSVVKYTAQAHEAGVVRMMDSIAELLGTRLTDAQVNSIRGSVQKVGHVPVELWVARWGTQPKQLAATIEVPGGNKMRFVLQLKQLNAKVVIAAPEKAVPLSDAVASLRPRRP